MQARHHLAPDLRKAVGRMAFDLHYQPQIDLRTGQLRGFEALLRWTHPTRGPVPPAAFIPVAEKLGYINPIGEWVLERACREAAGWPAHVGVAVNVSPLQIKDGMLEHQVARALGRSGLAPERLELEITETCMIENAAEAATMLGALRGKGVRIALDDFGTGYSSLGYLPHLPLDKIKIDRSFVINLGAGRNHTAIVRAIVDLCAGLGLGCIAEGIETSDQVAILLAENCTEGQGYLLGRPGPASGIPALLQAPVTIGAPAPQATPQAVPAATRPPPPRGAAVTPSISFEQVVHTANDIVLVTDANLAPPGPTILYVNPAFTRLTGYEPHEAIGLSPRILQGPGTSRATLDQIAAALRAGREVHRKVLNYAKCGAPYWLDLRIVPLRGAAGEITGFVAVQRDVTLDKRRLDELEYVADRDMLTGIPNRRALLRSIDAELQAARARGGTGPALAFIDVDEFKQVNDRHGHAAGDAVLFGIADRLAENVRRIDTVGRVGGEEFAVCMPASPLDAALAMAERLRQSVAAAPFDTPVGPLHLTVSIGVAAALRSEHSLANLMERADRAMYAAKRTGRNRVAGDPVPDSVPEHAPDHAPGHAPAS